MRGSTPKSLRRENAQLSRRGRDRFFCPNLGTLRCSRFLCQALGQLGGKARAKSLTKAELSKIGKKGAQSRFSGFQFRFTAKRF
jgi:hypothetical protein